MSEILWKELEPEDTVQCGDMWWEGSVNPNVAQYLTDTPTYHIVFAPVKEYGLTIQRIRTNGVDKDWHCWRPTAIVLDAPAPPEPANKDRKIELEL